MIKLGAHIGIARGLSKVPIKAKELGCQTIQIFSKNPRSWQSKALSKIEVEFFIKQLKNYKISPLIIHTNYLLNLATKSKEVLRKSKLSLLEELKRAKLLKANFLVTHIRKGEKKQIIRGINWALDKVKDPPVLLLEGTPNLGLNIFKFLGEIIHSSKYLKYLGICLDTCHIFAAGFDISKKTGWQKVIREVKKFVDFKKLYLIHINDSKGKLGSKIDRHQYIGKGFIGIEGFSYLINNKLLSKVPMIIETPKKVESDDKRNLNILRSLQYNL